MTTRRMVLVIAGLLSGFPSMGWGAYQSPTVVSNERQPTGFVRLGFLFTGDAGEPTVRREYTIGPSTTAAKLRNWVDETIQELEQLYTVSRLPSIQPGQTIPRLARVDPTPTGKQVWLEKFRRYLRVKDSGIVAVAGDLAALKADLEATYQPGYLDE